MKRPVGSSLEGFGPTGTRACNYPTTVFKRQIPYFLAVFGRA